MAFWPPRKWSPLFIKATWFLKILSWFAPISIGAITLGALVLYRGSISEETKRHETIHFQQQIETLFIGFLVLYLWDFLRGLGSGEGGADAYANIRAEREAYSFDHEEGYLEQRRRYQWLRR